jgi:erythromycin esterase
MRILKYAFYNLLFSVVLLGCQKKDIKQHVVSNISSILTIEPDSTDFTDLLPIGDAIGESRIVMLGEQDHGDAPTFLAKTRLIKYLHEKKGFNVLAFESDFFALNEGWDRLPKTKTDINHFLHGNIFPIWTECQQCEDLFYKYIPGTYADNRPLIISGFDSQSHGDYSLTRLRTFLDNYLKKQNINYVYTEKYKTDFVSFIDTIMYKKGIQEQQKFKEALELVIHELNTVDTTSFEMVLLKSLRANAENKFFNLNNNYEKAVEIRDKQMAENLKWLLKYKFPNEKIIVWAHNVHIIKHSELVKNSDLGAWVKNPGWEWASMGSIFASDQDLEAQTYVLGFNSRTGTAGRLSDNKNYSKKYSVNPPVKNSFESWIPETTAYAFVDFKQFRIKNPQERKSFFMKGLTHVETNSVWTDHFDGIFYILDMYPCIKSNLFTETRLKAVN